MTTRRRSATENALKNTLIPLVQAIGRSGRLIYFVIFLVLGIFAYKYFTTEKSTTTTEYNTALIQEKIQSVGKLIVTEGHFAQVMTYKDQQKYLMNLISVEKKALIIINADVTVAYDLRQVEYDIDEESKTITILSIPQEEIKINPDIQFYDVEQSRMDPFSGEDFNKINKRVKADLAKKIEKSSLKSNAQNRLVSELAKVLILTNSMGWKLVYKNQIIESENQLNQNFLP